MDLKDIIKWFIPCFHIFLTNSKFKFFILVYCMFLFLNLCAANQAMDHNSVSAFTSHRFRNKLNYAKYLNVKEESSVKNSQNYSEARSTSIIEGRTFGRPMKKLAAALIPLAFQIGAASTWAVVAVVVGVKTLLVALVILKLLLVAGAAKFGSLFSHKTAEPHHGWSPPQKEIHLHIHNGHGGHEQHSEWNRDGTAVTTETQPLQPKPHIFDPFSAGPQTIHTPFGNYMKIRKR